MDRGDPDPSVLTFLPSLSHISEAKRPRERSRSRGGRVHDARLHVPATLVLHSKCRAPQKGKVLQVLQDQTQHADVWQPYSHNAARVLSVSDEVSRLLRSPARPHVTRQTQLTGSRVRVQRETLKGSLSTQRLGRRERLTGLRYMASTGPRERGRGELPPLRSQFALCHMPTCQTLGLQLYCVRAGVVRIEIR